jgi:hypothetical protein
VCEMDWACFDEKLAFAHMNTLIEFLDETLLKSDSELEGIMNSLSKYVQPPYKNFIRFHE